MNDPIVIDHDATISATDTSYIIQGSQPLNITFLHAGGDVIDVSASNARINLEQTVGATITDHTSGMHVRLDPFSLMTTFVNMQQDPNATIDLLSSPFHDQGDLANHLEVVPQGTILDAAVHGPPVAYFPGDYNVRPTQFNITPVANGYMDANQAEIYRLYTAAFGRTPDEAGEAYWSDQLASGNSINSIANYFAGSPEFQADYGSMGISDFVSSMYQNVLHREGDPAGVQFWTSQLNAGASEASVVLAFADSPENRMLTAPATGVS